MKGKTVTTIELWKRPGTNGNSKHLFVTFDENGHFGHYDDAISETNTTGAAVAIKLEVTPREFKQWDDMRKAREQAARTKSRKARHLDALRSIGFIGSDLTGLRNIEKKAQRLAEDECNREESYEGEYDQRGAELEQRIAGWFGGTAPAGFFLNGDPRGYALKLDNEKVEIPEGMHRDWGGFGILAPEAGELR